MPTIPVFVSSTFRDFHAERDALAGPVREALNAALRPLGCRVDLIDLRWGVDTSQDDEDAAQRRILDVCLTEIDRARPFFVGLLGDRYGTLPDPAHARWVADAAGVSRERAVEGLSVTALEFGHGFLWRTEHAAGPGGHAAVFVRHLPAGGPEQWRDPDPSAVAGLRSDVEWAARARSDVTVATYVAERAAGGSPDLDVLNVDGQRTTFVDLVVQTLLPSLTAHAQHLSGADHERVARRLFRESHPLAIGREDFAEELADRVSGRAASRWGVLGPWGTGKSALAVAVEKALVARGRPVVTAFAGIDAESRTMAQVIIDLVQSVGRLTPDLQVARFEHTRDDAQRWLRDVLGAAAELGGLTIVVDGLDRVFGDSDRFQLAWLASVPDGVGVLLTTGNDEQAAALQEQGFSFYRLGPLYAHEAAEAAQAWAQRSGRTLPAAALAAIGVQNRFPAWVRAAVGALGSLDADDFHAMAQSPDQARAIAEHLRARAESLPEAAEDVHRVQLALLAERLGTHAADFVLGLLGSSYVPLSVADLATRLEQGGVADPATVAATARNMLDDAVWESDRDGGLRPAHLPFMGVWQAHATPEVHAVLAEAAWAAGVGDDHERWSLLANLALAPRGRVAGESAIVAELLNAAAPSDTAGVLLGLTVAPGTRVLELIEALDPRALDKRAWSALRQAPTVDVDSGFGVTREQRDALARVVHVKVGRRWLRC